MIDTKNHHPWIMIQIVIRIEQQINNVHIKIQLKMNKISPDVTTSNELIKRIFFRCCCCS